MHSRLTLYSSKTEGVGGKIVPVMESLKVYYCSHEPDHGPLSLGTYSIPSEEYIMKLQTTGIHSMNLSVKIQKAPFITDE